MTTSHQPTDQNTATLGNQVRHSSIQHTLKKEENKILSITPLHTHQLHLTGVQEGWTEEWLAAPVRLLSY